MWKEVAKKEKEQKGLIIRENNTCDREKKVERVETVAKSV